MHIPRRVGRPVRNNPVLLSVDIGSADEIGSEKGHCEITFYFAEPDPGTRVARGGLESETQRWINRRRQVATLARLACLAEPFIRAERRDHRCDTRTQSPMNDPMVPPNWDDSCGITLTSMMVLSDDYMSLCLAVPSNKLPVWKTRITAWLELLASEEHSPVDRGLRS